MKQYEEPGRRRRDELLELVRGIDERTKTIDERTLRLEDAIFFGSDGDVSTSIVYQLGQLTGAKAKKPNGNGHAPGTWSDKAKAVGIALGGFVMTVLAMLGLFQGAGKGGTQ